VKGLVELVDVERALAARAADDHARAERGANRGEVLGRIGVAQRAADRPRLRTGGSAIALSASRKTGSRRASSSDSSRSRCRVSAPMRISPPCSRM